MRETLKRLFNITLERDNNYYSGLTLLGIGILSIFWYLKFDLFEPLSFLITFLICGWGFVLLWKSDNDLRFEQYQQIFDELEQANDCDCGSGAGYRTHLDRYRSNRLK